MKDVSVMIGSFLGRVSKRVSRATCRHDYHWTFRNRRTFLRCVECGHETAGWDLTGVKPPKQTYSGDPDRFRMMGARPSSN